MKKYPLIQRIELAMHGGTETTHNRNEILAEVRELEGMAAELVRLHPDKAPHHKDQRTQPETMTQAQRSAAADREVAPDDTGEHDARRKTVEGVGLIDTKGKLHEDEKLSHGRPPNEDHGKGNHARDSKEGHHKGH